MTTIHCKQNDPAVAAILARTWPGTSHRDIGVTIYETGGMPLTSCWEGGRRDTHRVLRLADMQTFQIPENGSGFTAADHAFGPAGFPLALPAPGFAVVTLTEGSYHALSIHIHRDNAAKLIQAPCELTWHEKVVLCATRSLKSSHGGKNRFQMANEELTFPAWGKTAISQVDWDATKAALIARKLLNAAGAITPEGKNAAGGLDLYRLRPAPVYSQLAADREVGETEVRTEV